MLLILFLESFCMFLYNFLYFVQFVLGKTAVLGQFNFRFQPKLGLVTISYNMDVHPLFFIGENLEHITAFPAKNWTHYYWF